VGRRHLCLSARSATWGKGARLALVGAWWLVPGVTLYACNKYLQPVNNGPDVGVGLFNFHGN
jgi:hypothetical protein